MNERSNAGNDQQHQPAEIVEKKSERHLQRPANIDPHDLWRRDVDLGEDCATTEEASENSRDRNCSADSFRSTREQRDCRGRSQRQEQHEPGQQSVGGKFQNLKVVMSSTCVVWRNRKRATTIARPTATSAAATV